ncbi:DUF885 domain-containing protein [Croceicoccus sp. BE223]|uniref:DUF885 domain-containing protein n=1 Tax=Croceicoccus sp. BE223 TaxID=2817716 RepID=UPI00285452BB|nr:DUF885 domain-containing protein [Croceicoccus sp. BE223]MDR7101235.1 uncharacterized protein (DUF885 family) [Croceicoccus sp. BE223]
MHRRHFLQAGSGLAAFLLAGRPAAAVAATPADARLRALMERVAWGGFRIDPSGLTALGLDTGANAWARSRLTGPSRARTLATWALMEDSVATLDAIDTASLGETGQVQAEILRYHLQSALGSRRFGLAHVASPYVLTQQDGLATSVPDFLDTMHPVETAADAEAYLSRLAAHGHALDDESEWQRSEAARGFVAPAWSLRKAASQRRGMLDGAAGDTTLVRSLVRRTAEKGIAGDWEARATALVSDLVRPALARQVALLDRLAARSPAGDGIWRVPDGAELYAAQLGYYTTTTLSADEIHRTGVEQVAEITGQLDTLLQGAGLSKGTVGERLDVLNNRPDQVFEDSAAGRTALLRFLEERVAKSWEQIRPAFTLVPDQKVEVRRVPPEIEQGASLGYYQGASADGSRPGAFYINLYDVKDWPRYTLPALIYHEAMPGHHLQTALSLSNEDLPLYLRNQYIGAYSEGWALYTEMVADELGMYEGIERAGALQSWLYRAARLVTDTGLHDQRWSREKGIDYFGRTVGYPANQTMSEVERYCAGPGQACSYKIGQNAWMENRKRAEAALGKDFSLPAFHAIVAEGEMPLSLLSRRVDAWVAAEKARLGRG